MKISKNLKYLTKGRRSFVFLTKCKNKKAIIKKARQNKEARINHEANILRLINKHNIGPKFFYLKDNQLCMEFIEGKTIKEFIETETSKSKIRKIAIESLNQCCVLDKLKINKEEMANPYKHIIITKTNKPIFIDFERSRFTEKPSNITQFFQYLSTNKLVTFNNELKQLLRDYKNNPSETNYKKLLKFVK